MFIKLIFSLLLSLLLFTLGFSQNLQVETLADLNASGGVTFGPDGHIYISDFGPALSSASVNTKVYKMEYGSWEISEFATGFSGASGARFDSQGNFYQSNPSGGRVSKVLPDGTVTLNWATGMNSPIGIVNDAEDNLYVCNCGSNNVRKIDPTGNVSVFSTSPDFKCPNGITIDPDENLYACNFSDGKIIKITPAGTASLFATLPTFNTLGNGHITYSNGFLFVATIGTGQIFKLTLDGEAELIAGIAQGFSNLDGPALQSTFSKPNGIAASITGDTLWINTSVPTWQTSSSALHPGKVRMITGVCSLPDVNCPLLSPTRNIHSLTLNQWATLQPIVPNPVTLTTEISFEIHQKSQRVKLKIRDAMQKELMILEEREMEVGDYKYKLQVKDWPSGMYFVVLELDKGALTRRLMVVD